MSGGHGVVADFGVAKAIESGASPSGDAEHRAHLGSASPSERRTTWRPSRRPGGMPWTPGPTSTAWLRALRDAGGRPPFTGGTAQSVVAKHMTAPRPHVGKVRHDVSDALDDVVIRAMAIDPADRFPDMERARRRASGRRGRHPAPAR